MKLSENQIEELFVFVRKHYVEHYDLHMELVDHLADGIEVQWLENPKMSFKEARQKEFKKFGVCGFSDIIEKRRRAMEKRYYKNIFKFYKEYFKIPKIVLLVTLTLLTFLCIRLLPDDYKTYFVLAGVLVSVVVMTFRSIKNYRFYRKKIGIEKRWMFEENIYNFGNVISIVMLPIHIINPLMNAQSLALNNIYLELGLAFFTVSIVLLSYIMIYVIPSKAQELLSETYPEYKLV